MSINQENSSQQHYINTSLHIDPIGITVAKIIMVVVDSPPSSSAGGIVFEPPSVDSANEETGMLAIFPLLSKVLIFVWSWIAAEEPGALNDVTWRLVITEPEVIDTTTMFLIATPAAADACWRNPK